MIIQERYLDWRGELREAPPDTVDAVRAIVGDEPLGNAEADVCCVVPTRQLTALSVQLYSLWSETSCGIGDLADLAVLARHTDVDLLLLNPLHAAVPGGPQQASPYFPSSRQFRNPLYLRVHDAPAMAPGDRIDRDKAAELKLDALERVWARFAGDDDFDRYRAAHGADLSRYATFCALSERYGRPWKSWPVDVRRPDGRGVAAFAVAHADRVRFHEWVQWQLDRQLAQVASIGPGLVNDVAIGFDPAGADAWIWQDVIAPGMHVGAPPDAFNRDGQNWGTPPFVPTRMASVGFRPWVGALEGAFAHAAGVRIDHVMGLFRQYWIPDGASPAEGVYVRYPAGPLLDLVGALSQQTGTFVAGEDLGTVEPEVRDELARRGMLAYRVLWFEDGPPAGWPAQALASVTTHDLPTIAGVWTGQDGNNEMREKLVALVGRREADVATVVRAVHAALRRAPSLVISETLEDRLGVTERPNRPGTMDGENWSRPLPVSVDDLG